MLRRYATRLHRARLVGDAALAAALFAALIFRPEFQRPGFMEGLQQVGLLAAVVVIGWPLLMTRCRVYSSQRRDSTGVRLRRLLLALSD